MHRFLKAWLQASNGPIHLVLDGWTSPIIFSYLGLVIIWCADGNIHRAVLEFIRYVEILQFTFQQINGQNIQAQVKTRWKISC